MNLQEQIPFHSKGGQFLKNNCSLQINEVNYICMQFELMAHNNQMEGIISEIQSFLNQEHTERELIDFINHFQPKSVKPTLKLHQINLQTLSQPTFLYAHLMVQDVRDAYFYYSFAIKRKYTSEDPFFLFKYGNICNNEPENLEDSKQFIHAMTDQYPVICVPVRYQSKWANQLQGNINQTSQIVLQVDGKADYKLGQIINVVVLYNPKLKRFFMVREMTKEEAVAEGLEVITELAKNQVDFQKVRHELMNILGEYCSQVFSEYLLITLISEQSLFLGCESNISQLVEQIYPRVAHIKIVHPCNQSLFPYKNEDGELQITPMQFSSLPTFVILDLSEFSTKQSVLIKGGEIENFSALKMFVQQGKTIYRWEMGESHVQHHHKGLIVKAAKLITPHFNPKEQKITQDFSNLKKISENSKAQIRQYLQSVTKIDPKLEDEQRKLIEKDLAGEKMKQKIGTNLADIMKISKLLARSHGRALITFQDFQRAKELIDYNQPSK